MGFRFRRSFKIAPGVRLNLSGSGASVSLGPRGFHYTVGPHGTRTTVGLPGSGISWTAYQPYSSANHPPPLPSPPVRDGSDADRHEPTTSDQSATAIDSAPIDRLVANSTIDIAVALDAGRARWRLYMTLIAVLSTVFAVAAGIVIGSASAVSPLGTFIASAGALIIIGSLALHGRESSTVSCPSVFTARSTLGRPAG
jgi:hypothetical protein